MITMLVMTIVFKSACGQRDITPIENDVKFRGPIAALHCSNPSVVFITIKTNFPHRDISVQQFLYY